MELDRHDPLWSILELVPGWRASIHSVTVLPGGITNRSYRVGTTTGDFVVRVPGAQTELLGIDRRAEASITIAAAQLNIAPAVLCQIPAFGTVVSDFVDARPLDPADIALPTVLGPIIDVLRRLHSHPPIIHEFPIFQIVRRHDDDARRLSASHSETAALLHLAARIETAIPLHERLSTLCHNDLLPANILLSPHGRVWLIDYEYAGMNHAMFDLANLSINASFDAGSDERLLHQYFGRITATTWAQLHLFKIVSELREGLWGLVQSAISTSVETDFAAYADDRLRNCAYLASHAEVGRWLIDARQ